MDEDRSGNRWISYVTSAPVSFPSPPLLVHSSLYTSLIPLLTLRLAEGSRSAALRGSRDEGRDEWASSVRSGGVPVT